MGQGPQLQADTPGPAFAVPNRRTRSCGTRSPSATRTTPAVRDQMPRPAGESCRSRTTRPRAGRTRPAGVDHRSVRSRGNLRRATGQGVRGGGHCRVQRREGRPGGNARYRSRHRPRARRLRVSWAALRRDPRHRQEHLAVTPSAGPGPQGHAGHRRRRDGRLLARRQRRQVRALLPSPFISQQMRAFICKENHEDLLVLRELLAAGKVTPAIDHTYPLSEAPKAIRYLEDGHVRERSSSPSDARHLLSAGHGTPTWTVVAGRMRSGSGPGRRPSARPAPSGPAAGRPASPTRRSGPARSGRGRRS